MEEPLCSALLVRQSGHNVLCCTHRGAVVARLTARPGSSSLQKAMILNRLASTNWLLPVSTLKYRARQAWSPDPSGAEQGLEGRTLTKQPRVVGAVGQLQQVTSMFFPFDSLNVSPLLGQRRARSALLLRTKCTVRRPQAAQQPPEKCQNTLTRTPNLCRPL